MAAPAPRIVAPAAPPRVNRMKLESLVTGRITQPTRVLLYGTEGIGKSTFGASAPKPIFICAENGTAQLDVARFPPPNDFLDVLDALKTLATEKHDFETLVIDTLDWLEPLIFDFVCKRDGKANIEAYGFQKGQKVVALDEWRKVIRAIEAVLKAKPMHVILLAHSICKTFKNPTGEDFDRYEMAVEPKAAGLTKHWVDAVLFTSYETFAKKDTETKRVRGVDTGSRLVYTERRAAFDAKNRYSLPPEMPLSWEDYWAGVQAHAVASPEALRSEILRKAADLGPELLKVITETVEKAGANPQALAQINNRVNARLAEQANNQPQADQKESVAS